MVILAMNDKVLIDMLLILINSEFIWRPVLCCSR